MASDPQEVATSSLSLPKRKKSSPKEEMVRDPEEAASPSVPKEKRKFSSEETEAAASATKSTKKKEKVPENIPRVLKWTCLVEGA